MIITMTGTAPLIQHNARTADPLDPYAKAIKEITAKRTNKTDADELEISRLKFAAGLYWDEATGPYLPAANVFRSLIEAGAMTRDGKKIERGVSFTSDRSVLEYDGPRDLEGLWGNGTSRFVDRRLAAVNRVRIPVTRPIFVDWAASFEVLVDDEVIDPEAFAAIAAKAGRAVGVGDYRRFYGRFAVEVS
jgi:hypothetical protein